MSLNTRLHLNGSSVEMLVGGCLLYACVCSCVCVFTHVEGGSTVLCVTPSTVVVVVVANTDTHTRSYAAAHHCDDTPTSARVMLV